MSGLQTSETWFDRLIVPVARKHLPFILIALSGAVGMIWEARGYLDAFLASVEKIEGQVGAINKKLDGQADALSAHTKQLDEMKNAINFLGGKGGASGPILHGEVPSLSGAKTASGTAPGMN